AAFNKTLVTVIKQSVKFHIIPRLMMAAMITGSLGYIIPGAMGVGSGAIDVSLTNNWQVGVLFALLLAKFIMTTFALGLGIPGGIVGPIIGIGAIAGALGGAIVMQIYPTVPLNNNFILLGMAGFMAASLNAPLAALLAVVESSGQFEVILPAMVVITISCVISAQLFNNRSVFIMQLDAQNLLYSKPPIEKILQKIGVLAIMKDKFELLEQATDKAMAGQLMSIEASTPIINKTIKRVMVNKQVKEKVNYYWAEFDEHIPLATQELSGNYQISKKMHLHKLIPLSHQATLAEAYTALIENRCGGVYIYQKNKADIMGIVTFEQIRHYLVTGNLIEGNLT
ncbi:MAG: chloride channel protein, partial [Colwellia sp.]|nr:chloride channel protein [Colwellia sp.]